MNFKILFGLLCLMMTVSQFLFADGLLKIGIEKMETSWVADVTKMSDSGRQVFQEMRELAVKREVADPKATYYHNDHGDRDFSVLVLTNFSGHGAVVQQVSVSGVGEVTRFAYKIPEATQLPHSSAISNGQFPLGMAPSIKVKRTWHTRYGDSELAQDFQVYQINGRMLRVTESSEYTNLPYSVSVNAEHGASNGKELEMYVAKYGEPGTPDRKRLISRAAGHFLFPEITGEIIGHQVNSDGTRLTFQTSGGEEYMYNVEEKNGNLTAKKVSFRKMGLGEFEVESKIYKGRAEAGEDETGHGMTVNDGAPATSGK